LAVKIIKEMYSFSAFDGGRPLAPADNFRDYDFITLASGDRKKALC